MGDTYNARHKHGILLLIKLPPNKDGQKENTANEEPDDSATLPGMCLASILQCENVASEQTNHQSGAHKVKLRDLLFPCGLYKLRGFVHLEEKRTAATAPTIGLTQKHCDAVSTELIFSGGIVKD
jgi:hypothetical protein